VSGSLVTDALVYLGAAVVCVPLASRLRLGSVLGYLGAGCLIGPFGLGLVSDPESTMHFSEIGVVLMLFIIGLELDPSHLLKMRRAVFLGGGIQLGACAVILAAAGLAAGLPWQGALIAGLALSLSSTAVSMQTMGERNLLGTGLGRISFAILLFQDIAAIPLVAIVPLLAEDGAGGGGSGSGAIGVLKVVGAIVAVVIIGRFVTRPILRAIARLHLREVFTAFTLLLVLGIAQLMTLAGVSMALGAFLAGVLLAGSEYRHALETDIQPFKGLLMGLFFIAVGMSINFGLFAENPLMVIGAVLGFQALKGIALASVARPLGVSRIQRWLFAALLVQGGEFAFVVFGVARTAKLLPGTWEGVLTLAVALSMALTPLFLFLYDRFVVGRAADDREADTIEDEHAPVIIAGFGRFGQIVGRLLFASGLTATVLDHDPDQIELLKRFGFRIYYGDATRLDLLEAAGANRAKLLVIAIDDPTMSLQLVDAVRHAFPNLAIVARARNVGHYRELRARGVAIVERETFESALLLGRRVLEHLGVGKYEARERADRFRRHNVAMLEQVIDQWDDMEKRTKIAVDARRQLEEQFERDRAELDREVGHGWRPEEEEEAAQ
jgi:glutathione-regulated potassium-efflux system ancillary protein KefC